MNRFYGEFRCGEFGCLRIVCVDVVVKVYRGHEGFMRPL